MATSIVVMQRGFFVNNLCFFASMETHGLFSVVAPDSQHDSVAIGDSRNVRFGDIFIFQLSSNICCFWQKQKKEQWRHKNSCLKQQPSISKLWHNRHTGREVQRQGNQLLQRLVFTLETSNIKGLPPNLRGRVQCGLGTVLFWEERLDVCLVHVFFSTRHKRILCTWNPSRKTSAEVTFLEFHCLPLEESFIEIQRESRKRRAYNRMRCWETIFTTEKQNGKMVFLSVGVLLLVGLIQEFCFSNRS